MQFEVQVPQPNNPSEIQKLVIEAPNWLLALRNGLKQVGDDNNVRNIMCDIMDDEKVRVTDTKTGRIYEVCPFQEEAQEAPPQPVAAASPKPAAPLGGQTIAFDAPRFDAPSVGTPAASAPAASAPASVASPSPSSPADDPSMKTQESDDSPAGPPTAQSPAFDSSRTIADDGSLQQAVQEFAKNKQAQDAGAQEVPTFSDPLPPLDASMSIPPPSKPANTPPTAPPSKPAEMAAVSMSDLPKKPATPAPAAMASPPPSKPATPAPAASAPAAPPLQPAAPPAAMASPPPSRPATPAPKAPAPAPQAPAPQASVQTVPKRGSNSLSLSDDEGKYQPGRTTEILADAFMRAMEIYDYGEDRHAAMQFVLELSMDNVHAVGGAVLLTDINSPHQELWFEVSTGERSEQLLNFRIPMGQGIVGFCAKEGISQVIANAQQDPRFQNDILNEVGLVPGSMLCSAIQHQKRVLGAIQLYNQPGDRPFTPGEMSIINYLAHVAGEYLISLV